MQRDACLSNEPFVIVSPRLPIYMRERVDFSSGEREIRRDFLARQERERSLECGLSLSRRGHLPGESSLCRVTFVCYLRIDAMGFLVF